MGEWADYWRSPESYFERERQAVETAVDLLLAHDVLCRATREFRCRQDGRTLDGVRSPSDPRLASHVYFQHNLLWQHLFVWQDGPEPHDDALAHNPAFLAAMDDVERQDAEGPPQPLDRDAPTE